MFHINISSALSLVLILAADFKCVAFVYPTISRSYHQSRLDNTRQTVTISDEHSLSSDLPSGAVIPRRYFLMAPGIFGSGFLASFLFPDVALSTATNTDANSTTSAILSATEIANLLHTVPTFTIVDTEGVPYMVVGEDARVTGYFFTTYTEAQRILSLARTSVDQSIREELSKLKRAKVSANEASQSPVLDSELLENPWTSARISSIPLDVAITLSLKGLNGNVRNYFQVAAAETDIADALKITNKEYLAEGKVPLFYYADFTLDTKIPLYFQKDQLTMAYRKQHPKQKPLPTMQVTELFAVLTSMALQQQKSSNNNDDDNDLQNIIFVPPIQSEQWVQQCMTNNKGKSPYVLGKRNIVL